MGIRSQESIALDNIANQLKMLNDTAKKMEKDLHSIDISLGILVGQMTEEEEGEE